MKPSALLALLLMCGCGTTLVLKPLGAPTLTAQMKVSALFRASARKLPVTDLKPQDFLILENSHEISAFESAAIVIPSARQFRLHAVLLIDVSGSMRQSLDLIVTGAHAFVHSILADAAARPSRSVRLYAFSGNNELYPLLQKDAIIEGIRQLTDDESNDPIRVDSALDSLNCPEEGGPEYCQDRSTNLYGAVVGGMKVLEKAQKDWIAEGKKLDQIRYAAGALVIFSDGTNRARTVQLNDALRALQARGENTYVFTVGLGKEVDEDTLRKLGPDGFSWAPTYKHLVNAFEHVGAEVSALAKSYYELQYCSPIRRGHVEIKLAGSTPHASGTLVLNYDAHEAWGPCRVASPSEAKANAEPPAAESPEELLSPAETTTVDEADPEDSK